MSDTEKKAPDLWPCPWCGGKAEERTYSEGTIVQCGVCGECRWSADRDKAIQKWNTRAADKPINIVFDGPPGPEGPRFIEVETDDGNSIRIGEWIETNAGCWALRITELPKATP